MNSSSDKQETLRTDVIYEEIEERFAGIRVPLEKTTRKMEAYRDLARQLERELATAIYLLNRASAWLPEDHHLQQAIAETFKYLGRRNSNEC